MTNQGYEEVKDLVTNVMGFNDWLQDREPVEPNLQVDGHFGGMNFTIPWLNGDRTRFCIRFNLDETYDIQVFQYQSYRQVGLQLEKGLARESILMMLSTLYQELVAQSNQVLESLKFELTQETQDLLKYEQ